MPTSMVTVRGIPDDWLDEETFARFEVAGLDEWVPVYIELVGGGEAELFVPIHPDDHMNGGTGELVVYNENGDVDAAIECPPFSFSVERLDPMPGTVQSMIAEAEQLVEFIAETLGHDLDDLMESTPNWEQDAFTSMLAANLQLLSGDGADSVRGVFDEGFTWDSERYEIDDEGLELVDALLATHGVDRQLKQLLTDLRDAFTREPETNSAGMSTAPMAANAPSQGFIVPPHMISTPRQLAYWMDVQNVCATANGPIREGVRDVAGIVLAGVTVVAPPAAVVTAPIGLTLTLTQLVYDMCEELLPSQLDTVHLAVDRASFEEDFDGEVDWFADLYVHDREWTLDLATTIGLAPGAGKFGKFIAKSRTDKLAQMGEAGAKAAARIGAHSGAFAGWVKEAVSTLWTAGSEIGKEFDGPEVGPIRVDPERQREEAYFNWRLHSWDSPEPFEFVNADKSVKPKAAGAAELIVETVPGSFQGQDLVARQGLTVDPIAIDIEKWPGQYQSKYRVPPDDKIDFVAHVENALDESVVWLVTGGAQFETTGDDHQIRFTAPRQPGDYAVTAISTANTGPRALEGAPPREATVTVTVMGGKIHPRPFCAEPGEEIDFSVYEGSEQRPFSEFAYSISGPGTLDDDGRFRATGTGSIKIVVWPPGEPELGDELRFSVQDECTGFDVSVTGELSFQASSNDPEYTTSSMTWGGTGSVMDGLWFVLMSGLNWPDNSQIFVGEPIDVSQLASGERAQSPAALRLEYGSLIFESPFEGGNVVISAEPYGDTYGVTGEYSGIVVGCDTSTVVDYCDDDDWKLGNAQIRFHRIGTEFEL